MKLKTRIIVGFGMSILVPLLLFSATLYGLGHTKFAQQTKDSSEVVYDISVGESTHSQTQVRIIAKDLLFTATVILVFTALSIGLWIYRSIATPLVKLKKATQNIKEGNLDFVLEVDGDDEFSELCRDFEEMRKRLKESAEEKVLMDKENKELISNISHDLKTPITAVKGYVEGIMDGVADTPEKIDRYVKTIYNKTNEMDHLINELTFYSKIDTNRIPYTFSKLNVEDYFSDCAEEVGLELETRGIELVYANYVEDNVQVIADGEQIRRVIHNIISNAIKYMDKPKGIIQIRIKDVGDFIQVEIEDNGKGIAMYEKQSAASSCIKGACLEYFPANTLVWAGGNINGKGIYDLLCENPTIRQALDNPMLPIDIEGIFSSIHGDVAVGYNSLSNNDLLIYADVTNKDFLQSFEDLKPLLAMTGGQMQLNSTGKDQYEFRMYRQSIWFGVKDNLLYISNNERLADEAGRRYGVSLQNTPWAGQVTKNRFFMAFNAAQLVKDVQENPRLSRMLGSDAAMFNAILGPCDYMDVMAPDWKSAQMNIVMKDKEVNVLQLIVRGLENL